MNANSESMEVEEEMSKDGHGTTTDASRASGTQPAIPDRTRKPHDGHSGFEDPYLGSNSGNLSHQGHAGSHGTLDSCGNYGSHGHGGHGHPVGLGYAGSRGHQGGHGHQFNVQVQHQVLRNAQASKQMVYEVFGNCITMMEEMENRELKHNGIKPNERSEVYLPDQSKFDDATIQRKLDTQLILLRAQLVSCDEEIKDQVKDELKKCTLEWTAARDDHIPDGITDLYAAKLFELVEEGHTEYPKEFDQPPTINEKGMQKAMQGIIQGQHQQAQLDKRFKDNPAQKAEKPKLRKGQDIDKGIDRVAKNKPKMEKGANNYRTGWK